MMMHPDDEPGIYTGSWCDHFNTYREACIYYGADTPEQLEAEAEWEAEQARKELAEMAAVFGPYVCPWEEEAKRRLSLSPYDLTTLLDDEIPF